MINNSFRIILTLKLNRVELTGRRTVQNETEQVTEVEKRSLFNLVIAPR